MAEFHGAVVAGLYRCSGERVQLYDQSWRPVPHSEGGCLTWMQPLCIERLRGQRISDGFRDRWLQYSSVRNHSSWTIRLVRESAYGNGTSRGDVTAAPSHSASIDKIESDQTKAQAAIPRAITKFQPVTEAAGRRGACASGRSQPIPMANIGLDVDVPSGCSPALLEEERYGRKACRVDASSAQSVLSRAATAQRVEAESHGSTAKMS